MLKDDCLREYERIDPYGFLLAWRIWRILLLQEEWEATINQKIEKIVLLWILN